MVIGIDASRAFVSDRTGTENYSYHLINEMLRLPESKTHTFILFIRPNSTLPNELVGYSNVIVKEVKWRYLWTQLGLAWETWQNPAIRVLWVPAHTLPVMRNPRIKTMVTIHGLEYQWLPEYKNLLQRWYLPLSTMYAAKYADKLIAVSQFTAKQLVKELHTNSKNIKVVYEGVAIHTPSVKGVHTPGVLDRYGLQSKKYILFVGTIQPRKNLPALIAAYALLSRELPDYKLVIAGGVGWMAGDTFRAIAQQQVLDKVILTGRVSQAVLDQLYAGAAVYVQPSITEGFGLPILEAMKYGVPVVSSDGGALTEVVGSAGSVVPLRGNTSIFINQLAREMRRVVGESAKRKKMIAAGKKRARSFSWSKAAKDTLQVLLDAAN